MPKLRELIDEMLAVQRVLGDAALEARVDFSRRSAVIDARRRFAQAVMLVSAAIDDEPQFKDDPALGAEFRQRFSEMRSKVAIFQAKWPAVLLDSNDPAFDQTAGILRTSNRDFTEWAQKALAH